MMEDELLRSTGERPVVMFRMKEDRRLVVVADEVEALVELEEGCQLVTGSDTYRVVHPFPEVAGALWPDLFRG